MNSEHAAKSTAFVAKLAGVHKDTLLRWLRQGHVPEPSRDRRGWRHFSDTETHQIIAYAQALAQPLAVCGAETEAAESAQPASRLEQLDWDFADAKTQYLTHGIHPYPAKYIPQIPNALIQELSSVGDTVADIFCGSGTTLVEALALKRHGLGIDANPLAKLITEAKTTRFQPGDKERLEALCTQSLQLAEQASASTPNLLADLPFVSRMSRPSHDAIDFWFEPHVIEELAEIRSWCMSLATGTSRLVALCAFSSIIVAVSKQDSDTRYVRRDKSIFRGTLCASLQAL